MCYGLNTNVHMSSGNVPIYRDRLQGVCIDSFIRNFQIPALCLSSVFYFQTSTSDSLQITLAHTRYGQSYQLEYFISLNHPVAVCPPNTVTNFNYTKELVIIILFFG